MITPSAPLPTRVWAYLLERFPPAAYTVLVGLFAASAFVLAGRETGAYVPIDRAAVAAGVVLLVFLHLRLMDEHKDHASDAQAYPERCLSRGVVTLPLLARMGWLAVAAEGVLATYLSPPALTSWAVCLGFTVLMRFEFGVGAWLSRHILVYAVTHNPIVGLLAYFLWTVAGGSVGPVLAGYLGAVTLGSLAFEIGRKVRLPHEEIDGIESYSSVLGKRRADVLIVGLRFAAGLCILGLAMTLESPLLGGLVVAIQVAIGGVLLSAPRRAKVTEGVATMGLLLDFIAVTVMAW